MPTVNCGLCHRFVGSGALLTFCAVNGHGFHDTCVKQHLGLSLATALPTLENIKCFICQRTSTSDRPSATSSCDPATSLAPGTEQSFQSFSSLANKCSEQMSTILINLKDLSDRVDRLVDLPQTVDSIRQDIAGVVSQLTGFDNRISSLEDITASTARECNDLQACMSSTLLRVENFEKSLESRLKAVDNRFNDLSVVTSATTVAPASCSSTCTNLARRLRSLELNQYSACVTISGLPELNDHTDLSLFIQLASKLEVTVTPLNILECSRMKSTSTANITKPRTLFVRLNSEKLRNVLLAAKRSKRLLRWHDLNITAELATNNNLIFVNEFMPAELYRVLTATKVAAKERGYKFTWMRNGSIYVKRDSTSPVIEITCTEDIYSKLH